MAQLVKDTAGVICRRDHPAWAQRLDRLKARGELVGILPGILVLPELSEHWGTRLRAGLGWLGPNAVVSRYAAARLTFWPDCRRDELSFAVSDRPPLPRPGWSVTHARIPPEMTWRRDGMAVTSPAYTAVDLAAGPEGGDVIDRALRSRMATLEQMWDAFAAMPNRPDNRQRRWLLHDSRDRPWSELERAAHRLFRRHHLTGWTTNARVSAASGDYAVDVLFRAQRLVIEFDGYRFHSDPDAFENDRRRRNELVLAGYTVLNFTWGQVCGDPDWVIDCIRRVLGGRSG